jgi:hypothetical protein
MLVRLRRNVVVRLDAVKRSTRHRVASLLARRSPNSIAGLGGVDTTMVLGKLEPMEALLPLIGEAWEHRRRRWRRVTWVAAVGVVAAIVVGALVPGSPGGQATPKGSGAHGGAEAAQAAVLAEPASQVFRLTPYIGGVDLGRSRPGSRHGYARLSIVLKRPARSVVADFSGRPLVLGYFRLPERIRPALRHANALGLLRHAVFVGYFVPSGTFSGSHRKIRVAITYLDGQRVVTHARVS